MIPGVFSWRDLWVLGPLGILALVSGMALSGMGINTTRSIPVGLYAPAEGPIVRGSIVLTCGPRWIVERGYVLPSRRCKGGALLMKRVVAVPGDRVRIGKSGVAVNGRLIPDSRPLDRDSHGNPLPTVRGEYLLTDDELLLMSDKAVRGLDARYLGPTPKKDILELVEPVVAWN